MPTCNICDGHTFVPFRGRPEEKCANCGSLARHRVGWAVYGRELIGTPLAHGRVLHLAPEPWLYPRLVEVLGGGYLCADPSPGTYPHAPCLKLSFPQDFDLFPEGYFDASLHNHVLEHIPGHYGDHLAAFTRLLAPGGRMIFSIPGPYAGQSTREGGEHLATDAERLEQFLQEDHYRLFGDDFVPTLQSLPGGSLRMDDLEDADREGLSVRPGKARFYIWQRAD